MAQEKTDFRAYLALIRKEWPDRELIPIRAVAAYLGCSSRTLIKDDTFPIVMVGNRRYIPRTGLARWLS